MIRREKTLSFFFATSLETCILVQSMETIIHVHSMSAINEVPWDANFVKKFAKEKDSRVGMENGKIFMEFGVWGAKTCRFSSVVWIKLLFVRLKPCRLQAGAAFPYNAAEMKCP